MELKEIKKKIIAIGGGENGRLREDGTRASYETEPMDREIIRITEKKHPNFLFLAHSQPLENQEGYYKCMYDIYNGRYNCNCKHLKSNELLDKNNVKELIEWADIIYEGGGDTLSMIKLWKETGFDMILHEAWQNGKVMCGVSAGANCWFEECSTDSLKILYGNDQPIISMKCLGFQKGFFVPHCDEKERYSSVKKLLKENNIGILMSNCTALEIIDNKFRIISSDASNHNIEAYSLKTYWNNGEYIVEKLEISNEFKELSELYKTY